MHIYLPNTWVLLASTFSIVAAQDRDSPIFTFDGTTFQGELFSTQSSVFLYQNISQGKNFSWDQTGPRVDVVRVDLMNAKNESILFWCSDPSCVTTQGLNVSKEKPQIYLSPEVIETLHHQFLDAVLFFRVDWQLAGEKRDEPDRYSSYSQEWAIADDHDEASSVFGSYTKQMTAGADAARTPTTAPTTFISALTYAASSGTIAPTTLIPTTTSAASTGSSGTKSRGLTTGAIVGIVVGCVGGLILVSVVAGCLFFRRRRNAGVERGGSRGVQDIIAEKEARASILDKDQPDTPYSEQTSQHPLHRGLGLAGRNESGVDLGIGQAISGDGRGSVHAESLHTLAGANDRNSALYSSLGGAANSGHGTPVVGSGALASGNSIPPTQTHTPTMSAHDRSSAMGSPVPRASSQLDRSLSPYRDSAGQHDYGQHHHHHHHHHHVVDGADLVQQEHSNDGTARSPSSLYSTDPLDELQPISPESAHDNGGGGASPQPPGHGRSTTPSGVSGQYAHLVEDGMTEDEIRRMEEEERALDEAIEQDRTAGRKR